MIIQNFIFFFLGIVVFKKPFFLFLLCLYAAALLAWNQEGWHTLFPAGSNQPEEPTPPLVSALLRVWQWCLSGTVTLMVHDQCSLRCEGVKWGPWQLEGLCGALSARSWAQTKKCCWQTTFMNCFVECQLHFIAHCHMPVLILVA